MSSSPDQTRPSKPPLPVPDPTRSNELPKSASSPAMEVPNAPTSAALEPTDSTDSTTAQQSLVPKRPLMRPVNRPQPPSATEDVNKPATVPLPTRPEPVTPKTPAPSIATVATVAVPDETAGSRHQPIPPPSEPKQYRAIGLVRGRYNPSDEQFTRGEMITGDGTPIEAVLLGRVMSLVKNHLDLGQEHLWVVYPRTRETQEDLHVQIVGVWEPEKLHKPEDEAEDEAAAEAGPPTAPEPATAIDSPDADADLSPGFDDNYFSVRGEVVFYAPEKETVIVKIQQAPRKNTDKAKAFKLQLRGILPSEKALGYFWDLQVQRQAAVLVITTATAIGLVPPQKKPAGAPRGDRKSFKKRPDGRGGPPRGTSRPPSGPPVRREPLPKPAKRTEPSSEG